EGRTTLRNWIVRRAPVEESDASEDARPFERWYEREFHEPHEHDWIPVGCHYRGDGWVFCSEEPGRTYFTAVPLFPDPAKSVYLVDRVRRSDHSQRFRLIERF